MRRIAPRCHADARLDQERHAVGLELPDRSVVYRSAMRQCGLAPARIHVASAKVLVRSPPRCRFKDTWTSASLNQVTCRLFAFSFQQVMHGPHSRLPDLVHCKLLCDFRLVDVDLADRELFEGY